MNTDVQLAINQNLQWSELPINLKQVKLRIG